ncbi:hypothetical protein H5410_060591 [Solanum commersonii]|uniref:Uncharacterized protein n=1 Tax=Solanum commersonii TaxID=4109 RepID=A0A9J5W5V7_SOLCO|nr:hypothetical protein H5410_060591 [Solanum commersonii]
MQCVPPIYVTQAQPSVTLTSIVDPYELLEKELKLKEEECDKEMRELREEVRNKKTTETFREYAICWRSEAARVRPPVDENEMKYIFIKAQDNMYYERMLLMTGAKFTDLVKTGEALEEGIKSRRVTNFTAL